MSDLEKRIQEESVSLSLDEYKTRFTKRYKSETSFQEKVHTYFKLSNIQLLGLKFSRFFIKGLYERKTSEMITELATKVYEDSQKALSLEKEQAEMHSVSSEVSELERQVSATSAKAEETQRTLSQIEAEKAEEIRRIETEYQRKISDESSQIEQELMTLDAKYDAEKIAREKIKEHLISKGTIKVDSEGRMTFDEQVIAKIFEDRFLQEIVDGIDSKRGGGFMSSSKREFDGVISYWAPMEDIGELADIDWMESTRYSWAHGSKLPKFPHLIVGKRSPTAGRTSLPTAISMDVSSSMGYNNRLESAKKTCLALRAYMRKMNPENESYLSVFSGSLQELDGATLLREVGVRDWTRTDLALDWLYEKLEPHGCGIAYLITDGYPAADSYALGNPLARAIESAKKFADLEQVLLRIFLMDPDEQAERNVKKIGKAAGHDTKFMPISSFELGEGVIIDASKAIGQFYSI